MVPALIAAGAISVFGKIQQGLFAREQGLIANREFNLQADLVLRERAKDVQYMHEFQNARRGGMKAGFARGGVDVNSGSAFEAHLAQSRFDAITRSRAIFESQLQARQLRFQGAQAKAAGKQAFTQSILSSFGSIANVAAVGGGGSTFQSTAPVNPATGGAFGTYGPSRG